MCRDEVDYMVKHNKRIAEVLLTLGNIHIIIPDCFDLIRADHQPDFEPHHHGIKVQTALNFMGEKLHPDLIASWQLPEDLPIHGERVYTPPTTLKYRPKCRGSFTTH